MESEDEENQLAFPQLSAEGHGVLPGKSQVHMSRSSPDQLAWLTLSCRLCSGKESALVFQTGGGLLWVVANTHILIARLNAAR